MPFAWQLAGLLSSLLHIPAIASGGDYRKQSLYFIGVGWPYASGGDYQQNRFYIYWCWVMQSEKLGFHHYKNGIFNGYYKQ